MANQGVQFEILDKKYDQLQLIKTGPKKAVILLNGKQAYVKTPILTSMFGFGTYKDNPKGAVTCCFSVPPEDSAFGFISEIDEAIKSVAKPVFMPTEIMANQWNFTWRPSIQIKLPKKPNPQFPDSKFYNFYVDAKKTFGSNSLEVKIFDQTGKELAPIMKQGFKASTLLHPYEVVMKDDGKSCYIKWRIIQVVLENCVSVPDMKLI
jgi:hypothetical protein